MATANTDFDGVNPLESRYYFLDVSVPTVTYDNVDSTFVGHIRWVLCPISGLDKYIEMRLLIS